MKRNYTYKAKIDVKPIDTANWKIIADKNIVESIPLVHSNAVGLASKSRRDATSKRLGVDGGVFASNETSQSMLSARKKNDKVLDKGIQLYRLWYNFVKLALELEELKVELVVEEHTSGIKNHTNPDIPRSVVEKSRVKTGGASSQGIGSISAIFRTKITQPIKVKRSSYKGWDLNRVLTEDFNTWWDGQEGWGFVWKKVKDKKIKVYIPNPDMNDVLRRGHSHLFEGYYPAIIKDKKDWVDNPDFIYLRIDKNSTIRDVNRFYEEEIRPQLEPKVSKKFKISGKYARVKVIQNNFNALVLRLKGLSPEEICNHNPIYLRSTDEVEGRIKRGQTDRLVVSKDPKGKILYSQRVSIQRNLGIEHLLEVVEGRFGSYEKR